MTTNKHLIDVADEMAAALKKLTEGLAKDGVALEGFTDAIAIQNKWAQIKLKRTMERWVEKQKKLKFPIADLSNEAQHRPIE